MVSFPWMLLRSLNPAKYNELSKDPHDAFVFLTKTVGLGLILLTLLALPAAVTFSDQVLQKLGYFSRAELSGNFTTEKPILIPDHDPWIVVDTEGKLSPGREEIFVGDNIVSFLGTTITHEELKDLKENKVAVAQLAAPIAVLLLPGLVFWVGLFFWLKYLAISAFVGVLGWLILDLTHLRQPFAKTLIASMHAAAIMVLIELISLPLSADYLYPLAGYWRISLYAVSTIAYLVLFIFGIGYMSMHAQD